MRSPRLESSPLALCSGTFFNVQLQVRLLDEPRCKTPVQRWREGSSRRGGASPACFPSRSDLVCMHEVAFATKLASSCGKHRSLNFISKLATETKTLRVFQLRSRWEMSDGTFLHINIFIAQYENSEVTQLHCQQRVPRDSSPCYCRAHSSFPTSWSVVQVDAAWQPHKCGLSKNAYRLTRTVFFFFYVIGLNVGNKLFASVKVPRMPPPHTRWDPWVWRIKAASLTLCWFQLLEWFFFF